MIQLAVVRNGLTIAAQQVMRRLVILLNLGLTNFFTVVCGAFLIAIAFPYTATASCIDLFGANANYEEALESRVKSATATTSEKLDQSITTEDQIVELPLAQPDQRILILGIFQSKTDAVYERLKNLLFGFGRSPLGGRPRPTLERFARFIKKTLNRDTGIYSDFRSREFRSQVNGDLAIIHEAIEAAVTQSPNSQVIAFNLAGIDPRHVNADSEVGYWTNNELAIILSNPKYFNATRWYEGGRALAPHAVLERFGAYRQNILEMIDALNMR